MKQKHHLVSILHCWKQRIPFWACVALEKRASFLFAKGPSAMPVLDLVETSCPQMFFQTCLNLGMAPKKVPAPKINIDPADRGWKMSVHSILLHFRVKLLICWESLGSKRWLTVRDDFRNHRSFRPQVTHPMFSHLQLYPEDS